MSMTLTTLANEAVSSLGWLLTFYKHQFYFKKSPAKTIFYSQVLQSDKRLEKLKYLAPALSLLLNAAYPTYDVIADILIKQ